MTDLKQLLERRAGRADAGGSERLRQRVVMTLAAREGSGLVPRPRQVYVGPLVGLAAAVVILIVIGSVALFARSGSVSPGVAPSPTTVSPPTTASVPDTSEPVVQPPEVPPVTSGTWTLYGPLQGLDDERALLAVDGNGDVFSVSQQTGAVTRFLESSVTGSGSWDVFPAPDPIRDRWVSWAVGLPGGGLIYHFGSHYDDDGQVVEPGGVIGFDGSEWFSPTLPDGNALVLRGTTAAEVANDGSIWVGDFGDDRVDAPRFLRFADGDWTEWAGPPSIVGPGVWNAGTRISVAPDGALWSVVRGGAARQNGEVIDLFDFERTGETCCLAWVQAAPNGDVWVHADTGVDRYRDGNWVHFDTDDGLTSSHPDEYAIPTSDGSLWLQNEARRVSHFDGRLWRTYTSDEATTLAIPVTKPGARLVPFATAVDGNTWVLTHEGVLHQHDGTSWSLVDPPPDIDLSVGSLVVTPAGHVWVTSGEQFVALFEPRS